MYALVSFFGFRRVPLVGVSLVGAPLVSLEEASVLSRSML